MADSYPWMARSSAHIRLHRGFDAGDYPDASVSYCWHLVDKAFRHDYDLVTYDEEGNEVKVQATDLRPEKAKPDKGSEKGKGRSRSTSRSTRVPPQPSWRRSFRRGGMWGGVMLVVIILFFKGQSLGSRLAIGALYAALFVPLTYWIDRFAYRNYERRNSKS